MRHDFLSIGDIATDAFIKLKDAWVETDNPEHKQELCMLFGEKIPYESVTEVCGVGNSANAAVCATRLGLSSGLISNVGGDENGKKCLDSVRNEKVNTDFVYVHKDEKTNYHFVLSYGAERTILVKHEKYKYSLPNFPTPRWLYLSSLGHNTEKYHEEIADWLNKNPETKLAFQPGSFQIALGTKKLAQIYARTDVFVCNLEEALKLVEGHAEANIASAAARALGIFQQKNIRVSGGVLRERVLLLFNKLHALGPKQVIITNGPKGAYFSSTIEGVRNTTYFMPPYPDPKPPTNRTGAGDSFAATFVSYLALGMEPLEALKRAPINSAYVVQEVGAQKGLLSREKLEEYLVSAPKDFSPQIL